MWRVNASGRSAPERVAGVIDESVWPSAAKSSANGVRIVYQTVLETVNLTRWPDSSRVCPSTRREGHAQISPDGRQVAFSSNRGGSSNLWICEPDGTARQITFFPGSYTDSPRWSPDGNRIVFTSHGNGSRELFLADLKTGEIRTLTNDPSDEGRDSFSRDGKHLYFRSNRSGANEIWKMPIDGGRAKQITTKGAMEGFESPDGKLLYYVKDRPRLGVWSVPCEGGEEAFGTEGVRDTRWSVARDGIYFVTPQPPFEVRLYRFDKKATILIHSMPAARSIWAGFAAAFDGKSILWPETVTESIDLAVLDL